MSNPNVFHRPVGSFGKYNTSFKTQYFWRWYYKYERQPIPYSKGRDLYGDLLHDLALMSITTGEYFFIANLGYFSAVKFKKDILDENGKVKMKHAGVDWKATKEHWKEIYPTLTAEEIKKIEDRPHIYHKNKLKFGNSLKFRWIKVKDLKKTSFLPLTCIESELGKKANSGAIGNMTNEDFNILVKTLRKTK
jgi:hypothetical protein